jgi:ABC-2 type transport system ATP-binding protein
MQPVQYCELPARSYLRNPVAPPGTLTQDARPVTEAIVQIRQLSKRYGALTALDSVTLDIQKGEIFALLGPNGAGKTTLIGIVAGLTLRTSGEVLVAGHDVTTDYRLTRRTIGLVPQEINFDPFFTVEEALRFQAGYFGRRLTEDGLVELLKALGLLDKRKSNMRTLSGGMKRRILIAKALAHDPEVLFLDEPTAGVDVELRRDLWNYVRILRARGKTIVLTTHYLEEAEELADRVGIIDKGKLQLVEEKTKLLQRLGTRVLTLSLTSPVAQLPAKVAAVGGRLSANGGAITFTDRPSEPLGARIQLVTAAGLEVRDIDVREPRLEDVFLQLLHKPVGT